MGLLNKFFRPDTAGPPSQAPSATQFHDSDDSDQPAGSRSAPRRELVQVVLRETMRRHAVPSNWIDCRILSVVSRNNTAGMHVQLIVKQGQGNLLTYIPAFQSSFMAEIEKFEPRAWDWLLSISWQFDGISSTTGGSPDSVQWKMGGAPVAAPVAAEPEPDAPMVDDDISQDLQALFAIRDAAMARPSPPSDQPDFESTRPGFANSGGGAPPGR